VGRVHEQVFTSIVVRGDEWGLKNKLGRTRLLHHGYTEELTRDRNKVERNLRLIEQALEEIPGDPNLTFNHGLELVRSGKLEAGLARYGEAAELLGAQAEDEIVPELREVILTQWMAILKDASRFDDLLAIRRQPLLAKGPVSPSMHYMLGFAALRTGDLELSVRELQACLATREAPVLTPVHRDLQTGAPEHCLALALVAAKQPNAARDAFALALKRSPGAKPATMDFARFEAGEGDFGRALTLIYELVQASPDDVTAWRLGAAIALNRPEVLEVALDWTGSALEQHPNDEELKARRAEALLLAGRPGEALPLFRALGAEASVSNRAALLLCQLVATDGSRPSLANVADLNQNFLQWYRRLVDWNSVEVVQSLNARMDVIAEVLPGAAKILQSVLADLEA
jgi:tetratricopeptide (TPR) repeat protein